MKKLRVVLADDHTLVRAGIGALLNALPNVEVVGEAGNGVEALELVRKLSPQIALLDLAMPVLNGVGAAERIAAEMPSVKIIIFSVHLGAESVRQAFRAGATGFLAKDAPVSELAASIHAVTHNERYLDPILFGSIIEGFSGRVSETPQTSDDLTPRQREVLRLIAEGQNTKEIASTLRISSKTVEAHRAQLMERLGLRDIPRVVRYAMRTGLVPPEPFNPQAGDEAREAR